MTDQLVSPRVLVDSLGQVVAWRDFMPFGEEIFPYGTHRKYSYRNGMVFGGYCGGNVISRHDYHPFGEEILTAQRTQGLGYDTDTVRKKFTGYDITDYKKGDETYPFAAEKEVEGQLKKIKDPSQSAIDAVEKIVKPREK